MGAIDRLSFVPTGARLLLLAALPMARAMGQRSAARQGGLNANLTLILFSFHFKDTSCLSLLARRDSIMNGEDQVFRISEHHPPLGWT